MVRTLALILGIGLLVLSLIEIESPYTENWVVWLGLLAAFVTLFVAVIAPRLSGSPVNRAAPFLTISIILFGNWVGGIADPAIAAWLPWWNFVFALAYLAAGIAIYRTPSARSFHGRSAEEIRRNHRKSA